jgi:hypothetical protein
MVLHLVVVVFDVAIEEAMVKHRTWGQKRVKKTPDSSRFRD